MQKLEPNDRLKDARLSKRLTQDSLAEQIGTSSLNVGRWERGEAAPNSYFIGELCAFFQMKPEELGFSLNASKKTTPKNTIYDPATPLLPPIRLIGRDKEFAQLKQRLCVDNSVVLKALHGLPGVGKTTLAISLAHDREIQAHFHDGVLWAGLGPHPNIYGILSRWGMLLKMSSMEMATLSSIEAWANAIKMAIGSRKMLLMIDDAWQTEDALIFKLGGPNCAHLVTTRFPMIAMNVTFNEVTTIHELAEEEGMSLLRLLAPVVVEHEETKAHDLVQAVGGLPLALTLIGNYLRMQAHTGSSRRIHTALERLSDAEERLQLSEPRGPGDRFPSLPLDASLSLQSVISITDQQLDVLTSKALYALSVFPAKPQSFSEESALAIANCSVEILDTLMDAGLLESSPLDRYTLHQTIADYARVRLKDDTVYERFIKYNVNYIRLHEKDYEALEKETSILLVALESAYRLGMWAELVNGICSLAPFLLLRGLYSVAEQHLQRACNAVMMSEDQHSIIGVLLYLGETAQKQGDYIKAEEKFQEGLKFARRIDDHERISALLTDLGWVTLKRGEYAQAELYLQEGLMLAREIGDRERISALLELLGSAVAAGGEYTKSNEYIQEGLALARQIGDRQRICTLLINLGVTVGGQGNDTQAEAYFQEALTLARQIGHREWISLLLINLGGVATEQGNYVQAEIYFQEGLTLVRQLGHREWISALLSNLGLMERKRKNYIQAELYFQESLDLARQIGRTQIIAHALNEYGSLYLEQMRLDDAEKTFHEMLNIMPEGDMELLALAQYGLACTAAGQGKLQEARKLGELSLTVLEAMGHRKVKDVKQWLSSVIN